MILSLYTPAYAGGADITQGGLRAAFFIVLRAAHWFSESSIPAKLLNALQLL